jgi:signal peptidase I
MRVFRRLIGAGDAESLGRSPSSEGGRGTRGSEKQRSLQRSLLVPLLVLALALVLVFAVVRPFVAEAFYVPSGSMAPALQQGDRVLANKLAYRFSSEPERGDLIAFESPEDGGVSLKRVVGIPGDEVEVYDGVLLVNGEAPEEPYVEHGLLDSTFFGPQEVPADHVFVMGDNRSNSVDSRSFGAVPEGDVLGEVSARFWPPRHAALLAGGPDLGWADDAEAGAP